jgi:uncharacterized protein YybS (DUF2232 family)
VHARLPYYLTLANRSIKKRTVLTSKEDRRSNNAINKIDADQLKAIVVTSIVFSLPTFITGLGLFHCFIPLPVYFYLVVFGKNRGTTVVTWAIGVVGLLAAITGGLSNILFTLTLISPGFILAQAWEKNEPILKAGAKGWGIIAATWLGLALVYSTATHSNLYQEILLNLDKGFEASFAFYENSGKFEEDYLKTLKIFFDQLQDLTKRLFPALVVTSIFSIIWLNLIVGHWLFKKKDPALTKQDALQNWRLPEMMVWLVILAAIAAILPQASFNTFGINLGLALGFLYFAQGLAILSSMLTTWTVSPLLKVLIYSMLFLQSYGMALLAALGLTDVWIDFRKRLREKDAA